VETPESIDWSVKLPDNEMPFMAESKVLSPLGFRHIHTTLLLPALNPHGQ
jgi:hypothetical protein